MMAVHRRTKYECRSQTDRKNCRRVDSGPGYGSEPQVGCKLLTRCTRCCFLMLILFASELLPYGSGEMASPSPSETPSVSGSPSSTSTPSETASLSETPSISSTAKRTLSPTGTPSLTGTRTPSVTSSAEPTPSITATASATASRTTTPSSTLTGTKSATLTPTRSSSFTSSAERTPSITATPSATASRTASASPLPSFVCGAMEETVAVATEDETFLHLFFPIVGENIGKGCPAFRFLIGEKLGADTDYIREVRVVEGNTDEELEQVGVGSNETGIDFVIIFSQGADPTFVSIDEEGPPSNEQLEEAMADTISSLHDREFRATLLDTLNALSDVNINIGASLKGYIIVVNSRCTAAGSKGPAAQTFYQTSIFVGAAAVAGILLLAVLAVLFIHGRRRKLKKIDSKTIGLTPTVVSNLRGYNFRSLESSAMKVEETEDNVSVVNPRLERKRINKKRGKKK